MIAAEGDIRMMLALLIVLGIQIPGAWGIYGGCMSYSTTIEPSGNLKVRIYIIYPTTIKPTSIWNFGSQRVWPVDRGC
jgi:hypothetical protein